MGIKGDKLTKDSELSAELMTQKLGSLAGITTKRMFGGHGIFHNAKMFGLIDSKGQVYLKADDSIKSNFENAGSHRHSRMPYFSIPEEVLSNADSLVEWANRSIAISK